MQILLDFFEFLEKLTVMNLLIDIKLLDLRAKYSIYRFELLLVLL